MARPAARIRSGPATDADVTSPLVYACPNCLASPLGGGDGGFFCAVCQRQYPIVDGIPIFEERPAHFYWGVPPDRMETLLAEVNTLGWHDAMLRMCRELPPAQAELLWLRSLGYRRGAVQMLLPMGSGVRILDFGCGWGAISLHLAARTEHVVAMDQSSLHVRWVQAGGAARRLHNLTIVQGGDTRHLPFADGSFDAVVLNGVLEHVAVSRPGNPRASQRDFLIECARVLKPDGLVYIGIENRLNYKYFLGVREGHIAMKYGALLPRWLTHWYLMRTRKRPYREYTYSLFGYRRLLREAGLGAVRFMAPWPTYGSAGEFFPVRATAKTPVWEVEGKHPASRWPGWYFARAYAITAAKGQAQPALIEEILRTVANKTGQRLPWKLRDCVFKATSGGKATIQAAMPHGPDWLIQIGLAPLAARRVANQYRAMSQLHEAPLPATLKQRIPKPIVSGDLKGYFFGARHYAVGALASRFVTDPARRWVLCDQALSFLCDFQSTLARRVSMDETRREELIRTPFRSVREWFSADEWAAHEPWFAEKAAWVEHQLGAATLPVVPCHGDFVPENCMWDETSQTLSHVIDWELFEDSALPLIDWVSFVGGAYASDAKAALRARGENPSDVRFYGYPEAFLGDQPLGLMHAYMDRMQIDRELLPPLLFMWWIRQMHDWAALLQYYPDWRRLRVFPVIDRWNAVLGHSYAT
jgi:2-polyprenyl-3-methyl-5-hydroxy-6-metoxy-1,4-benzoquinol methylase